jgi:hypothetical protein
MRELDRRRTGPGALGACVHEHHDPVGIGVGKRAKEHGVDDREDGGRGADAQRERRDGGEGERALLTKRSQGILDVLDELFHAIHLRKVAMKFGTRAWG